MYIIGYRSRAAVHFSEEMIILGQLSVHISSPKVVYCLYNLAVTNMVNERASDKVMSWAEVESSSGLFYAK